MPYNIIIVSGSKQSNQVSEPARLRVSEPARLRVSEPARLRIRVLMARILYLLTKLLVKLLFSGQMFFGEWLES